MGKGNGCEGDFDRVLSLIKCILKCKIFQVSFVASLFIYLFFFGVCVSIIIFIIIIIFLGRELSFS